MVSRGGCRRRGGGFGNLGRLGLGSGRLADLPDPAMSLRAFAQVRAPAAANFRKGLTTVQEAIAIYKALVASRISSRYCTSWERTRLHPLKVGVFIAARPVHC